MVTVRLMSASDYDAVYDLWMHTPGMGLNSVDDSREGIEKYLKRNPNSSFVAECDGTIVGVILSGHDGRRGFLYHADVAAPFKNQGIGKKLVNCAVSALEKEGIGKVTLVAFRKNKSGNEFWEHMGFTEREDLSYRNKNLRNLPPILT